jgi:hypothetical protein
MDFCSRGRLFCVRKSGIQDDQDKQLEEEDGMNNGMKTPPGDQKTRPKTKFSEYYSFSVVNPCALGYNKR